MKLPQSVENVAARFNRMSLRERALVAGATLIGIVMFWMLAFLDPATAKDRALSAELAGLQDTIITTSQAMESAVAADPTRAALAREDKLKRQLEDVNAKLASKSAGLIPPERMVQVIHDVLSRQHGVTLVSLHNKPVTTLTAKSAAAAADSSELASEPASEPAAATAGPYVHPIELVVEGRYLDVMEYLRALETLPWRFYWTVLELQTADYPTNRVRIELSTLSMDRDWIGV
jgi:MSHA biogenesis protein MshJ